ncbi:MAG: L-threonylcarbamoyladenylate synthase [Anaerorhabdus sp.]
METKRYEKKDIEEVVQLLKDGKVVAFPTDTVYGLGVIYENEEALEALKRSKGRPDNKPIPTMVGSISQMQEIANMNQAALKLANAFMPGAFTMILKKQEYLPSYITNGFDTIGIRMPKDDFVLELIKRCDKPLLVTSANLSGEETGVEDQQVLAQLDGRIDGIVMGSAVGKVASTIVDMSQGDVKVVREGPIDQKQITDIIG